MEKQLLRMLAGSLLLPIGHLTAQTTSGSCVVVPTSLAGADACAKGRDLFAFLIPQVGVALSGGNPVLGEGGTMGGWGKRAISARLTAVDGRLPNRTPPLRLSATPGADDFGAVRAPVPVPSVDAAVGILKGIPLGITNVGGVDALLGATYVPTVDRAPVSLAPSAANMAFSYGARLGVLQESALIPGLSISWMRRKLPTLNLGYAGSNDTVAVRELNLTSNALRVTASKRFLLLGLAAGVGRDQVDGTANMGAVVNETVAGIPQRAGVALDGLRTSVTRSTAFVNASLSVLVARVVAELGWSSAGSLDQTINRFGSRQANEGYGYGSLGITVRF